MIRTARYPLRKAIEQFVKTCAAFACSRSESVPRPNYRNLATGRRRRGLLGVHSLDQRRRRSGYRSCADAGKDKLAVALKHRAGPGTSSAAPTITRWHAHEAGMGHRSSRMPAAERFDKALNPSGSGAAPYPCNSRPVPHSCGIKTGSRRPPLSPL